MPFGGRGDARRVLRRGERDVKRAGEGERSGKKADRTGAGWNEGRAGGRLMERESGWRIFRANDVPGRRIFRARWISRANDVLRVAGFPDEADFSGRAGGGRLCRAWRKGPEPESRRSGWKRPRTERRVGRNGRMPPLGESVPARVPGIAYRGCFARCKKRPEVVLMGDLRCRVGPERFPVADGAAALIRTVPT